MTRTGTANVILSKASSEKLSQARFFLDSTNLLKDFLAFSTPPEHLCGSSKIFYTEPRPQKMVFLKNRLTLFCEEEGVREKTSKLFYKENFFSL